jgi:hypothetical protein
MYKPVFTQPPETWTDWWSATRRFAAGWYGIAAGEVTGYQRNVDRLGRQLGVSVSPSIHEWAAFAADLQQAGIFGRAIRDRFTLGWDPETQALTLLTLSENDVRWGVRHGHLAAEDPPVDTWLLDPSGRQSPRWWRRHTATTSQFALSHLIGYLHGAGGGFLVYVPPSAQLVARLQGIGQTSTVFDGAILIEDDDMVILVGTTPALPDETDIIVKAEIGASRIDSIPQLLADLARAARGGAFHGAFLGLRNR